MGGGGGVCALIPAGGLQFGEELFQIFPLANGVAGGFQVAVLIQQAGGLFGDGLALGAGFGAEGFQRGVVAVFAGFLGGFAPFQLAHEEFRGHGGVGFVEGEGAAQRKQICGAGKGVAQGLGGLVDAGGHLGGDADLRRAAAGKAVGVGGGLEFADFSGEGVLVQREFLRQPEQGEREKSQVKKSDGGGEGGEVIGVRPLIAATGRSRKSGNFRQVVKLSPQPQASLTLGLLNLKPSCSPSRT